MNSYLITIMQAMSEILTAAQIQKQQFKYIFITNQKKSIKKTIPFISRIKNDNNHASIHFSTIKNHSYQQNVIMSMNSYLITIMQAMSEILTSAQIQKQQFKYIFITNQKKSNHKNDHSIHFSRIIIYVNE